MKTGSVTSVGKAGVGVKGGISRNKGNPQKSNTAQAIVSKNGKNL